MRKWRIGLFIVILLIGVLGAYYFYHQQKEIREISNFDACAAAGFPVMDSYPGQCRTPDGRSFTQGIGNELQFINEILLSNPRPNQKIPSPLKIQGKAIGMWYFEGRFSAELYDKNNILLGNAILTAQGEWMTEEFVPFEGSLKFEKPESQNGKLIIKNANPSGLPENEKALTVPVNF